MSQTSTSPSPAEMTDMVHRLKTRLALANFKLEHGIEDVDLRMLESSLYENKFGSINSNNNKNDSDSNKSASTISPRLSSLYSDKKKRKVLSHHRFYPTSPPLQHNDVDRLIKKNASRLSPSAATIPLSEMRSQHYYKRQYNPYSQHQLHPFINSSRHYYSSLHNHISSNNSGTNNGTSGTRKLSATLSSDDEDAAHLLVLMHQSPTMSS